MRKLLVIYCPRASITPTTHHYVDAFRRYSSLAVDYLAINPWRAPAPIELSEYDAVFLSYCARLVVDGHVPDEIKQALADFGGLTLVAVQDEYERTHILRRELADIGADLVLTCVPQAYVEYVYPPSLFPMTEFVTTLTGYAPELPASSLASVAALGRRPIGVGYRARRLPARYGRLGRMKSEIAVRVGSACAARGISHDISTEEKDRIYGDAWFRFVGSCQIMLGSESGSNVFDLDGSIERLSATDPSSAELDAIIATRDAEINMGQISPRIFEAAAMGTPLLMFRGQYSGILEPDIHYIPLEHDYSNLESALDRTLDMRALTVMAERTHCDLIASGRFSYATFVKNIDAMIESAVARKKSNAQTIGNGTAAAASLAALVTRVPGGHEPHTVAIFSALQRLQAQHDSLMSAHEALSQTFQATMQTLDRICKERNALADEAIRLREDCAQLRNVVAELQTIIQRPRPSMAYRAARYLARSVRRTLAKSGFSLPTP